MPSPRANAASPAASAELDELTLVRAQRGEEAACRQLVGEYQRRVFALLGRMLGVAGRGDLVEDLAQETFLRVFRALPAFDRGGPARLSTWILTIATRLALDELRRPRPLLQEPLGEIAGAQAPDARLLREPLMRAVAALTAEQRATFLLREAHGLDYQAIAEATGADLGTVKSRLSRAKAALRAALAEMKHE